jgi:AcrR family transcriptional regulator
VRVPEPHVQAPAGARQRILDITLALYDTLGGARGSISLIVTELGISAGNLRYHFRRKDELSAALLEQFVAEFDAPLPPSDWRAERLEFLAGEYLLSKGDSKNER